MTSRATTLVVTACLLLATSTAASADITGFLGVNGQPSNRTTMGFAAGFGVLIIGFEFEYARARENEDVGAPSLSTGMGNLLLQTPFSVSGVQVYATAGVGGYRERLGTDHQETNVGTNLGGGVKIRLAGPLRLRLDYRLFVLQGSPLHRKPQRFYAGLNFGF